MSYRMSFRYIAGFFDGEGCISCRETMGYPSWQIIIVQKSIVVLKVIKTFLLRRNIETGQITEVNTTGVSCLRISDRINQAMFLNAILPYLIVKKDQAEECLKWLKERSKINKGMLHLIERNKIKELRNQNLTYGQIAREIDRPMNTIYSYCQREGLLN